VGALNKDLRLHRKKKGAKNPHRASTIRAQTLLRALTVTSKHANPRTRLCVEIQCVDEDEPNSTKKNDDRPAPRRPTREPPTDRQIPSESQHKKCPTKSRPPTGGTLRRIRLLNARTRESEREQRRKYLQGGMLMVGVI
jgi:hypothetical protein